MHLLEVEEREKMRQQLIAQKEHASQTEILSGFGHEVVVQTEHDSAKWFTCNADVKVSEWAVWVHGGHLRTI